MLGFLEKNLRKKILLAEIMYNSKGHFSDKEACERLGISVTTIRSYEKELQLQFQHQKNNSALYNSNSLLIISYDYLKQSIQVQLLDLFIRYPGENAQFYKQRLNLTSATFSRMLRKIRSELAKYNISLFIKNGYHLYSENELQLLTFISNLARFFNFSLDDINNRIEDLKTKIELTWTLENTCNQIINNDLTFNKSQFEYAYNAYFKAFSLLRYLQKKTNSNYDDKDVDKQSLQVIEHSQYLYQKAKKTVEQNFDNIFRVTNQENYSKSFLKIVLAAFVFHISTLPIKIPVSSLRMYFFSNTFKQSMPEKYLIVKAYLYRLNKILQTNLFYRHDIIGFFIMSEMMLAEKKYQQKNIYIHSNINHTHAQFLFNQLQPLNAYFDYALNFFIIENLNAVTFDKNNLLISNEFDKNSPENFQFLISDYLSLQESIQISLWLTALVIN